MNLAKRSRAAGAPWLALLLLALAHPAAQPGEDAGTARPRAVLLVGNSYTYYHSMPAMLEAVARDRGHELSVEREASGGATLEEHLAAGRVAERLSHGAFDLVVLQEQSSLGVTCLVEGLPRVDDDRRYRRAAAALVELAQEAGARPFLLGHWRRLDAPERDQLAIDHAVGALSRETGAGVVPCGLAWRLARERADVPRLYDADDSHPSPAGAYLTACTLFACLTGESPVGAPARIEGPLVEPDDGADLGRTGVLVDLPEGEARRLQELALEAATTVREEPASFGAEAPPALEEPRLEPGLPLTLDDLAGTWRGTARHYPRFLSWPAELELEIDLSEADGRPEARLRLSFGGTPADVVVVAPLELGEASFAFVDPSGPDGGEVRYRGVLRDGTLRGVAAMHLPAEGLSMTGSWEASR